MSSYTASEMIEFGRAIISAEADRMSRRPRGVPRAAWRFGEPLKVPNSWRVRDTKHVVPTFRTLLFAGDGNIYNLAVLDSGSNSRIVEWIDLRAPDADARLAHYESV